ncbi:MAG: hypothetical protein ABI851_05560 [Saprospiraceae bacterium]
MTRNTLINNISALVQSIENEDFLQSLYELLKNHKTIKPGELWNSLTQDQKDQVLKAFEDSENEENLIPEEKIFK